MATSNKSKRAKSFKPPGPATSASASSAKRRRVSEDVTSEETSTPLAEGSKSSQQQVNRTPTQSVPVDPTEEFAVPPKLLGKLMELSFEEDGTKMGKDALNVWAKYVDTFVRETVARAAYERKQARERHGGAERREDVLEVEDLEKLAPQLLLDF